MFSVGFWQLFEQMANCGASQASDLFGGPAILGPSGSLPWLLVGSEDPWLSVPAFWRVWLCRCYLRSVVEDWSDCLVVSVLAKVVCTTSGKILGASILGPRAGEAITEIVIAMKAGITIDKLASFTHVYPIMNRIIRRLGDERFMAKGVGTLTKKLLGRYQARSEP